MLKVWFIRAQYSVSIGVWQRSSQQLLATGDVIENVGDEELSLPNIYRAGAGLLSSSGKDVSSLRTSQACRPPGVRWVFQSFSIFHTALPFQHHQSFTDYAPNSRRIP
jgi:hypothetical protein